jgi:hypothetical protein
MIVYKKWQEHKGQIVRKSWACDGWFLFGFLPLYIRKYPL